MEDLLERHDDSDEYSKEQSKKEFSSAHIWDLFFGKRQDLQHRYETRQI